MVHKILSIQNYFLIQKSTFNFLPGRKTDQKMRKKIVRQSVAEFRILFYLGPQNLGLLDVWLAT